MTAGGSTAERDETDAGRDRSRAARFLLPAAAFAVGLGAACLLAGARAEPWPAVYRQEAVAVVAARGGVVAAIDRPHGAEVRPGETLATLDDRSPARLERLRDAVAVAREAHDRGVAHAALETSQRSAPLERDRLDARLRYADLLRRRFDDDLRRHAAADALRPIGFDAAARDDVSLHDDGSLHEDGSLRGRLDAAGVENDRDVLGTQVALCEERLAELDRLLAEVPVQVARSAGLDRLRDDLAAAEARLATAAQTPAAAVVSPAFGRVGVFRRQVGDAVAAGETLVEVFDAERPFLLLTVPVAESAAFRTGRRVTVAFPQVESRKPFAGVVGEAASEAETDSATAVVPGAVTVRVRIAPAGRLWPVLPPGATALVTPAGE